MSETSLPWLKHYPEGFPAEINPDRFASIPALFDTVAETYGDHPAFICMDKVLTYREICDLSKDFAGYLQSLPGMKPGDRVAIMMPNLQQYIITLLGILRAGMIAVNVNPLYTSHELGHQLADSGAKAIVIIENFAKTLQNTLSETPVKHIVTTKVGDMLPWLKRTAADFVVRYVKKMVPEFNLPGHVNFRKALSIGHSKGFKPFELKNTDVALLQYTGGTTGVAKGAMLTHRNVLANVEQTGTWISQTFEMGKEVAMTALPLYHIFSFTATLCFSKFAATQVMVPNPRDIPGLVELIKKWDFSIIPGVNDSSDELREAARFIRDELGPDTPWHLTAFRKAYHMTDHPETPVGQLEDCRALARGEGLHFVYTGNVISAEGGNTYCPECNAVCIERQGWHVRLKGASAGICPACGHVLPGVWR